VTTTCFVISGQLTATVIVDFSVALNRPEKMNAMNNLMWEEIGAVFDRLARDPDCRAIVLRQEERVKVDELRCHTDFFLLPIPFKQCSIFGSGGSG
jgi:hypothetical protein